MQETLKLSNFRNKAKVGFLALLTTAPLAAWAQPDLGITSVVDNSEIYGTEKTFVKPHDGGSKSNTTTWSIGDSAKFILSGKDDSGASVSYGLKVTAVGASGGLAPNTDSLMIAQTVDSQGLTDASTLSVYAEPDIRQGFWDLSLKFSFYDLATPTFTKLASPTSFSLTALDLDYDQRVMISDNTIQSFTVEKNSEVDWTSPGSLTNFKGSGDSEFYNNTFDTKHAVQAFTNLGSEFVVTVGSGPNAPNKSLFMFDFGAVKFSDPVTIPVPEPSTALLLSVGGAMFTIMRRRRPTA
ncbi:MAG TPA: PEP-CTERM sorting domain-containing protein [Chthoniobacterales bacterium]